MTENPYDGLGGRCPDTDPNEHDAHTVWMDGELLDAALELVRRHGFDEGYIRPMAFVGADPDSNTVSLTSADRYPTRVAVLAWPRESHEDPDGLDVMVSSWRKHASDQIPTTAKATGPYVNSLLASKEARRSGRDDGIVLNTEGNVAEGATSNLFLVRDGELFTPGVAQSPLEGITRRTVLTLADELGYPAHPDATIGRGELYTADELFLVGTAKEVAPIRRVDNVALGGEGPVTEDIRTRFFEVVKRRSADHPEWFTRV